MNLEELRSRYRPQRVRMLLIGESPPAGGTFFYTANSNLFRYTREAYEAVCGRRWESGEAFLEFLKRDGFFLDDLCSEPVNNMRRNERRRCREAGVTSLNNRIKHMSPAAIAVTPKAIMREAKLAIAGAGLTIGPVALPFPAMSWQPAYVKAMAAFIRSIPSVCD